MTLLFEWSSDVVNLLVKLYISDRRANLALAGVAR